MNLQAIGRLALTVLPALLVATIAWANPYWQEEVVPTTAPETWQVSPNPGQNISLKGAQAMGLDALRVRIDWDEAGESYSLGQAVIEPSGTGAMLVRSRQERAMGSYRARLRDPQTNEVLAFDAIGTGRLFRMLTRAISFRFPVPNGDVILEMEAEHPQTGAMEVVFSERIYAAKLAGPEEAIGKPTPEVRILREPSESPFLVLTVYAEGYQAGRQDKFWRDAERVAQAFERWRFPHVNRLKIQAVYAPSNMRLGSADDLGLPVQPRDSFLGLYYPYWQNFGRWYHIVYPTSEEQYRAAIGQVPYDYPIAVVDSSAYWGVGNYMSHTAIPADNSRFDYLLMHEFGHYLGLNEEYEGGGRTELEFAPEIDEPWSQNITFKPTAATLKWKHVLDDEIPIPTPRSRWRSKGPLGAYAGGYADSLPHNHSHKPGFACTMSSGREFCGVCLDAMAVQMADDMGLAP